MTENELKKLNHIVRIANNRLKRMQEFSGKDVSWAAYNLQSRLDGKVGAWSKNNLIHLNDNMSEQDLSRVLSATTLFLKSKTSTISGIKTAIRKVTTSIGVDLDITKDQANDYYRMLKEDTFTYFKDHSAARSSEMWAIIEETKEKKLSYGQFEKKMLEAGKIDPEVFKKIPDQEIRMSLRGMYSKEIKNEEL